MLDQPKSHDKSVLGQRVMSAKMLRFKQLQNQLADAHYHLNASLKKDMQIYFIYLIVGIYIFNTKNNFLIGISK